MAVEIIFETHSTTFDNEAKKSSGWNDVELSPLGLEQSQELGTRRAGEHFDAVFCSDLMRATKTAEIAFTGRDISIIKDARLRECDYGEFTQADSHVVEAMKIECVASPFPGGESYEQTTARMADFLTDLARDYAGKRVLIIGHRATQYGLENVINKVPLKDIVSAKFAWQPGWEYTLI